MSAAATGTRAVDIVSGVPEGITWSAPHMLLDVGLSARPCTYPLDAKQARKARYIRLKNFSYGNLEEVEFRYSKTARGLCILLY